MKIDNKDHIQTLLAGIAQKRIIALDYFAKHDQQHTQRDIEPIGLFYKESHWHLVAFCRMRNGLPGFPARQDQYYKN